MSAARARRRTLYPLDADRDGYTRIHQTRPPRAAATAAQILPPRRGRREKIPYMAALARPSLLASLSAAGDQCLSIRQKPDAVGMSFLGIEFLYLLSVLHFPQTDEAIGSTGCQQAVIRAERTIERSDIAMPELDGVHLTRKVADDNQAVPADQCAEILLRRKHRSCVREVLNRRQWRFQIPVFQIKQEPDSFGLFGQQDIRVRGEKELWVP